MIDDPEIGDKINTLYAAKNLAAARVKELQAELKEANKALRDELRDARQDFKTADRDLDKFLAGLKPTPLFDGRDQ